MRHVVAGVCVLVAMAVVLASSAAPASSPRASGTETFDLQPCVTAKQRHTASTEFTGNDTEVTISGAITEAYSSGSCVFDAFYRVCKNTAPSPFANVYLGNVGHSNTAPFAPP